MILQAWQIVLYNIPNLIQINAQIIVDHHIAKSSDNPPIYLGICYPNLI